MNNSDPDTNDPATTNAELRDCLAEALTKSGLHIIDCHLDYAINALLDEDLFEKSQRPSTAE